MENKRHYAVLKTVAKEGVKIMAGIGLQKVAINAVIHFGFKIPANLPTKACVTVASYFVGCAAYYKGYEIAERELDRLFESIDAFDNPKGDAVEITVEDGDEHDDEDVAKDEPTMVMA